MPQFPTYNYINYIIRIKDEDRWKSFIILKLYGFPENNSWHFRLMAMPSLQKPKPKPRPEVLLISSSIIFLYVIELAVLGF